MTGYGYAKAKSPDECLLTLRGEGRELTEEFIRRLKKDVGISPALR